MMIYHGISYRLKMSITSGSLSSSLSGHLISMCIEQLMVIGWDNVALVLDSDGNL